MQKSKNIYSKVNFKSIKLKYHKVSNNFLSENNQHNVNDVLSVTDDEATRPTFMRTRPALHVWIISCFCVYAVKSVVLFFVNYCAICRD